MKETKSTLEGFEIIPNKRSGNSTRQIDLAINLLFKGFKVKIRDHWQNGANLQANDVLFQRVLRRLESEHNLSYLFRTQGIKIDSQEMIIELL